MAADTGGSSFRMSCRGLLKFWNRVEGTELESIAEESLPVTALLPTKVVPPVWEPMLDEENRRSSATVEPEAFAKRFEVWSCLVRRKQELLFFKN